MSFVDALATVSLAALGARISAAGALDVERILARNDYEPQDFPALISPAAAPYLEDMARAARRITRLRFGNTMKLYAPLYISSECVNACAYCGYSAANRIPRSTLSMEDILREATALHRQGMRHLLLVAGENRAVLPPARLAEIAAEIAGCFDGIAIEVYPMTCGEYRSLERRGVTGIAVYQETYHRALYARLHRGPKADFAWRLAAPERAARGGLRDLGIGGLLGLADFRVDMACVVLHARHLMTTHWDTQIAVSFPRLRRAAGNFVVPLPVTDRQLAQAVFALRMVLPDADLVLSTREPAPLRDGLSGLGITRMSAGSKTRPGGYILDLDAAEQFAVADCRTTMQVASMLIAQGLDPVWKDFDQAFSRDRDHAGGVQKILDTPG
jgi:2-iminoacetate synthase